MIHNAIYSTYTKNLASALTFASYSYILDVINMTSGQFHKEHITLYLERKSSFSRETSNPKCFQKVER